MQPGEGIITKPSKYSVAARPNRNHYVLGVIILFAGLSHAANPDSWVPVRLPGTNHKVLFMTPFLFDRNARPVLAVAAFM